MFEAYRVQRKFQWDGWIYAPYARRRLPGRCSCTCSEDERLQCTTEVGSGCSCSAACRCDCGIPSHLYAGDIWIVMAGHPRKETILEHRMAVPDPSIPHIDELLKDSNFSRLTKLPEDEGVVEAPKTPRKRVATPA